MYGTHEYSWIALGMASFPYLDAAPAYRSEADFLESVYIWRIRMYGQKVKEEL